MQRQPPKPILTADVTALHLEGVTERTSELDAALAHLKAQARKKNVARVAATLHIVDGLTLKLEVLERGARLKVLGRGLYACSVDGLLNAIADVIREEHGSDPDLIDVYGRLLEG